MTIKETILFKILDSILPELKTAMLIPLYTALHGGIFKSQENPRFQVGSAWKKMATDGRSISDEGYKKGSSRDDGEALSSHLSKRPSGETNPDGTKRQKIAFGMKSKPTPANDSRGGIRKPGIQIKLNAQKQTNSSPIVKTKTTASIFNADDDDEEPEEMPPEARMRMRNIGRDTPTSAGPNSFGKTKQGFCDSKKVFEKSLKEAIEKAGTD